MDQLNIPELYSFRSSKIDPLNSQGMSYRQISEAVGLVSKGRITEIKNGKYKSLKESEYQALMGK